MRGKVSRRGNATLQSVLQVLRGDAVRVIRGRSERDREVIVDGIKEELFPLVSILHFIPGPEFMTYLGVVCDIPLDHHHLQYRKHQHQVPGILLASHQIHDPHNRLVAHITQH